VLSPASRPQRVDGRRVNRAPVLERDIVFALEDSLLRLFRSIRGLSQKVLVVEEGVRFHLLVFLIGERVLIGVARAEVGTPSATIPAVVS